MKEIRSRKTGKGQYVTDEEWQNMIAQGISHRFTFTELEPIQKLTPVPKLDIEKVVIKKTKSEKND